MARKQSPLSMEYVILGLLAESPKHGYEIHQLLQAKPGIQKIWTIKQPLLYAKLDTLEGLGFLQPQANVAPAPGRKVFELTDKGREALDIWLTSPVKKARNIQQEFLAKLITCADLKPGQVANLIALQEAECQKWHQKELDNQPPDDAEHRDEWLVHSYRLNREAMLLDWLQQLREQFKA